MKDILWKRIVIGGFLSELAVFAVFIPSTVLFGVQLGMYTAVIGSFIMPFLFALWTTAGAKTGFVFQGMLVGAVGILIYIGLSLGQPEPLLYIAAHVLKLLGGAGGGYVMQLRAERAISSEPSITS